ncbi:hypothetical protein PCE1_004672 [Barthelona sp. PCE]
MNRRGYSGAQKPKRDSNKSQRFEASETDKNNSYETENMFDSDVEDDSMLFDQRKFTLNKRFARNHEYNVKMQELARLRDLSKQAALDEDLSTDDEDAALIDEEEEAVFADLISRIRNKDKSLVEDGKVFKDADEIDYEAINEHISQKSTEKKFTLKDYERERLLKDGYAESDHSENEGEEEEELPYAARQEQTKERVKNLIDQELVGESDEDDLFTETVVSKAEKTVEEAGFTVEADFARPKKSIIELKSVDGDFLKNYLFTDAWRKPIEEDVDSEVEENEENFDLIADDVERKYNFKHVGESTSTVTHVRNDEDSMRIKKGGRKESRKKKKEMMSKLKQKEEDDERHLRNLRAGEINERMEVLIEACGSRAEAEDLVNSLGGTEKIMTMDFINDWDQIMEKHFDNDYYVAENDEGEEEAEEETYYTEEDMFAANYSDDESENVDLDKDRTVEELQDLVNDYFKNDVNEVVSKAKTSKAKFKYFKVAPNSYGLTDEELLFLDEDELNERMNFKKLAPYRRQMMKHKFSEGKRTDSMRQYQNQISRKLQVTRDAGVDSSRIAAYADVRRMGRKKYGINQGSDNYRKKKKRRNNKSGKRKNKQ